MQLSFSLYHRDTVNKRELTDKGKQYHKEYAWSSHDTLGSVSSHKVIIACLKGRENL